MTNKTIDKRFDNLFGKPDAEYVKLLKMGATVKGLNDFNDEIKSFLHQALKEERESMAQRIVEGVEMLKFTEPNQHKTEIGKACHEQHNKALSYVISLVKRITSVKDVDKV